MSSSSSIESYYKPTTYHDEGHRVSHEYTNNTHHSTISKIHTHGEGNHLVTIGGKTYYRHELMSAFVGSLNPGPAPFPKNNINAAPLGLFGFAVACLLMGLINARVMGITIPNVMVGLAYFYGGLGILLAGLAEFFTGNTFAFTALLSYGAYWFAYGAVFTPLFGIQAAYEGHEDQFNNAMGFFMLSYAMWSFFLLMLVLKSTLTFVLIFFFLGLTYLLAAIGLLASNLGVARSSGIVGIITAVIAFYSAFAGVATPFNSYFVPSSVPLPEIKFGKK